jgi:hypothetical protein
LVLRLDGVSEVRLFEGQEGAQVARGRVQGSDERDRDKRPELGGVGEGEPGQDHQEADAQKQSPARGTV